MNLSNYMYEHSFVYSQVHGMHDKELAHARYFTQMRQEEGGGQDFTQIEGEGQDFTQIEGGGQGA